MRTDAESGWRDRSRPWALIALLAGCLMVTPLMVSTCAGYTLVDSECDPPDGSLIPVDPEIQITLNFTGRVDTFTDPEVRPVLRRHSDGQAIGSLPGSSEQVTYWSASLRPDHHDPPGVHQILRIGPGSPVRSPRSRWGDGEVQHPVTRRPVCRVHPSTKAGGSATHGAVHRHIKRLSDILGLEFRGRHEFDFTESEPHVRNGGDLQSEFDRQECWRSIAYVHPEPSR